MAKQAKREQNRGENLKLAFLRSFLSTICALLLCLFLAPAPGTAAEHNVVVVISANAEWRPVRGLWPDVEVESSPFGEWFPAEIAVGQTSESVIFFHGGWGKVAAAASTQYVIDRWSPRLLINLGTCGGFAGDVKTGETLLVERTIIYDIVEQMGDAEEAIEFYSTDVDLSWLKGPLPMEVRRSLIVSGDRDLIVGEIATLKAKYGAIAGDWESGAIAWVAKRNHTPCLILRTVSDLVSSQEGEAYGNIELFRRRTKNIMERLIKSLPGWLIKAPSRPM